MATWPPERPLRVSKPMTDQPDYVRRNGDVWNQWAKDFVAPGETGWKQTNPTWGIWSVSESDVGMFPDELDGKDAIELGCGTAYVSAWMARRGARVVAVDNSEAQLETARRLQTEHGLAFPLLHGNAERVPFPDASFDFAVSEYGASIWADPYLWVPEAARLLRPGGRLTFLVNSYLMALCVPPSDDAAATDRLLRPSFGLHRIDWPDGSINFYLAHGDWIRLLRRSGFEIEDLVEIRPPENATTRYPFATLEWARRWPCEEVWKARRAGSPH
jgi:SAM-dependent methyltransferase